MRSKRIHRLQDSIHGLMEFRGMETTVVDVLRSPELQRLRRIRQLGLAHLVFPGAEHSRLVHSLGAAHLAIRFSRHLTETTDEFLSPNLRPDESAIRDIALAALFHDIGHGPLSHVWEREVVGHDFDRQQWCKSLGLTYDVSLDGLKWHELVGQGILAWKAGPLHRLLEQQEFGTTERVRRLLLDDYYLPYLPKLLAGDVDVDRCDYVLRDAMQSGVRYGIYDLNWLIATLTVGTLPNDRLVVGFDIRKAPRVIEEFLIARRALYDTVYQHKTVRAAEGMLGKLFQRLKHFVGGDRWPLPESSQLTPFRKAVEGTPLSPQEVLGLDDYSLWILIQGLSDIGDVDPTLSDLASRVIARDLFKLVPCSTERLNRFLREPKNHEKLRDVISPFCGGIEDYYYFIDDASFDMLSTTEDERAYFVNLDDSARMASYIGDHPVIATYKSTTKSTERLYCIREAVQDIAALIG